MTEYYVEAELVEPDEDFLRLNSLFAEKKEFYEKHKLSEGKSLYKLVKVETPLVYPEEPALHDRVVVTFKDRYGHPYAAAKFAGFLGYNVTWGDDRGCTWSEILEFATAEQSDVQAILDTFKFVRV